MKRGKIFISILFVAAGVFFFSNAPGTSADKVDKVVRYTSQHFTVAPVNWQTVVNNGFGMPNGNTTFSSYGQPSVNSRGTVTFRARSTEGQSRGTGVYMRNFPKGSVREIADLTTEVPFPNNLGTKFKEFPAVPRIAESEDYIAFRGNHSPVYRFTLPDGSETRIGTTGIYVEDKNENLFTGASKLGLVPGFDFDAVPELLSPAAFDVFPGAPAVSDSGKIAFKGNYTVDGVGQTGVFFRDLSQGPPNEKFPMKLIAGSTTDIPDVPPSFKATTFGSTAPPSISGNNLVFVGLDNEDDPHVGGIYTAPMIDRPPLRKLVGIGDPLPDLAGETITRIGEGLSFDGRYVAFWGAWGQTTKTVRLYCPVDGEARLIQYCNGVDPNSVYDPVRDAWYQDKEVHVRQGIFVYDMSLGYAFLVAQTPYDFDDLLFWVYSGRPPGAGNVSDEEEVGEPPRWRSSAFVATSNGIAVFKGRKAGQLKTGEYVDIVDGLYMKDGPQRTPIEALVETGMGSDLLDPSIPTGVLPIIGVGIERDGFRGNKLAITASMADEENSWGGIYFATVGRGGQLETVKSKKSLR